MKTYHAKPGEVELYRGPVGEPEDKIVKQIVVINAADGEIEEGELDQRRGIAEGGDVARHQPAQRPHEAEFPAPPAHGLGEGQARGEARQEFRQQLGGPLRASINSPYRSTNTYSFA